MDNLYTDSWHLVRAGHGLPEAMLSIAPMVKVVQPVYIARRYVRRVRKWAHVPTDLWPGYAFIKGPFPAFSLQRCESFHGFVHEDEGGEVTIKSDALNELIRTAINPKDALCDGASLKFVDGHSMAGKEVTVRNIEHRDGREIVHAEVQTDAGYVFRVTGELGVFQPA